MSDDYERKLRAEIKEKERGTWRAELRAKYAPWFDSMTWGFECGDGWRDIIENLTAEIAEIVGGPARAPDLRVVQVKEKLGGLRYYMHNIPREHGEVIGIAKSRAEGLSMITCEVCGQPGKVVNSAGYWHAACPAHEDPRSFRV